jgi:hypothetical protein
MRKVRGGLPHIKCPSPCTSINKKRKTNKRRKRRRRRNHTHLKVICISEIYNTVYSIYHYGVLYCDCSYTQVKYLFS